MEVKKESLSRGIEYRKLMVVIDRPSYRNGGSESRPGLSGTPTVSHSLNGSRFIILTFLACSFVSTLLTYIALSTSPQYVYIAA